MFYVLFRTQAMLFSKYGTLVLIQWTSVGRELYEMIANNKFVS